MNSEMAPELKRECEAYAPSHLDRIPWGMFEGLRHAVSAPTTPLQLAPNGPAHPLRRVGDEGERVVPRALDHHHAPRDQGDGDPAALVDPPTRPVDVGQADRQPADPRREPPQGEPQATLDVILQHVIQVVIHAAHFQLHAMLSEQRDSR